MLTRRVEVDQLLPRIRVPNNIPIDTVPGAPGDPGMAPIVRRNIRALAEVRAREFGRRSRSERTADAVTAFAGSMWFVYLHATILAAWLLLNAAGPGRWRFDPYPFVMLAMAASVESIFLSTFILISQNRAQVAADRRAELDLQVSLLTEHELTRAVQLIDAVGRHLKVDLGDRADLADVERDVRPERVVEEIDRAEGDR